MPSNSLNKWNSSRAQALDEIEHAHLRVGGSERGRRYATLQINYAYVALLSSHFQGFCRDLHSESIEHIVGAFPRIVQVFCRAEFIWNRSLDKGNPRPAAIGSDFNRLGVDFWAEVYELVGRHKRRRALLEELVEWRNAIAHQDFGGVAPEGSPRLHLSRVRDWRRALGALAAGFDRTMYNYLRALNRVAPWQR